MPAMKVKERAVAKPKKGANRPRKPTQAALDAGRANLARGRARKDAQMAKARAEGRPKAGERWAALLSGTITVRDLDDEELMKARVRGADGGFGGRRSAIPSHLLAQINAERRRRALDIVEGFGPRAAQILIDIGEDLTVDPANRRQAAQYVLDRLLGKAPNEVHIKTDDPWGSLLSEALDDDRSLDDL